MIGYIIAGIIGGLVAKGSNNSCEMYYEYDSNEICQEGWTPCPKCQPNEENVGEKFRETGCIVKKNRGGIVFINPCPKCGFKSSNELLKRYGWYL